MSNSRIRRQEKEFQSARVKPTVVGRGKEMPLRLGEGGRADGQHQRAGWSSQRDLSLIHISEPTRPY